MILTEQKKSWIGMIKDALKKFEKEHGGRTYLKVKEDKNGHSVIINSELNPSDTGTDSGFSYTLNSKEDLDTILNSI